MTYVCRDGKSNAELPHKRHKIKWAATAVYSFKKSLNVHFMIIEEGIQSSEVLVWDPMDIKCSLNKRSEFY